jgi:hypothetical protein
MKQKITILIGVLALLILFSGMASAKTINVGPSGYDYTSISSAADSASAGDTIHVHAGTYTLTEPITLDISGVTLYGDGTSNTIIKVTSSSVCNSDTSTGYIIISAPDVEVYGFKFIGPATDTSNQHSTAPSNYRTCISLSGSSAQSANNVKIHDNYATLLYGDFVKCYGSSYPKTNLQCYNNYISCDNHDGFQLGSCVNAHIYNNYISTIQNCCIRLYKCSGSSTRIDHNTMTFGITNSGWTAIEYESTCSGSTSDHNVFINGGDNYWAAWYSGATGTATLTDNKIYNCPAGSKLTGASGFTATTSNNEVITSYDAAALSAAGYGYNSAGTTEGSQTVYNGTPAITLSTPTNAQSITSTKGNVVLNWLNVNSTSYKVYVSTNSGFSNPTTYTSSTNSQSVSVSNATYYWKVQAYDDSHGDWETNTTAWSFTITGDVTPTSGVSGYIYDTSIGNPIASATVTLMNLTWSATTVSNAQGFYKFSVPYDSGVYLLSASATNYMTTPNQLPINTSSGEYAKEDISLTLSPTYITPNYLTVHILTPWGTPFPGVTVTLLPNDQTLDSSLAQTKMTDNTGSAKFKIDIEKTYIIYYSDADQDVDGETTVSGGAGDLNCYVWFGSPKPINTGNNTLPVTITPTEATIFNVYTDAASNVSEGYINITIANIYSTGSITAYDVRIIQVDAYNQTSVDDHGNAIYYKTLGGSGNVNISELVPNNATYKVSGVVTNSVLSAPTPYDAIVYVQGSGLDSHFNFGWKDRWNYQLVAYIIILFIGGLFGRSNVPLGTIIVVILGFAFNRIGWLPFDAGIVIIITIIVIVAIIQIMRGRNQ